MYLPRTQTRGHGGETSGVRGTRQAPRKRKREQAERESTCGREAERGTDQPTDRRTRTERIRARVCVRERGVRSALCSMTGSGTLVKSWLGAECRLQSRTCFWMPRPHGVTQFARFSCIARRALFAVAMVLNLRDVVVQAVLAMLKGREQTRGSSKGHKTLLHATALGRSSPTRPFGDIK